MWHNRHVLTLRRARAPLAMLCVAAIVCAVLVPGVAALDAVAPPVEYRLLPQLEPAGVVVDRPVSAERLRSLRLALPERAPPVASR